MEDGAHDGRSEQAPAAWYDDPFSPGRMRYFDGQSWTDHYHEPGRLPPIDRWLSTTFSVFGPHWRDAGVLALLLGIVGNVLAVVGIRLVLGDLAFVDEELVNGGAGLVVGGLALFLFLFAWQGFGWLAVSRFMHRAHFQATPTVAESLRHALLRLPRYLLFMVVLGIGFLVILLLLGIASAVSPGLGALLFLAGLVAAVWVAVKLAFLVIAIAVAPPSESPISASAEVSASRFWPVLGRLALLTIGVWLVSLIVTASFGSAGQLFDAQALSDKFQFDNDTVTVLDFRFRELLPSSGGLVVAILINGVIQAAVTAVTASALVRLYLDSAAPSELLEPTPGS